mmetsp:Transcript_22701/g.44546  ORF Transcript_22701/g.44546 Transcript_22701/m.44546 type:complete len:108 (-) Transcript_22701:128-451(-)
MTVVVPPARLEAPFHTDASRKLCALLASFTLGSPLLPRGSSRLGAEVGAASLSRDRACLPAPSQLTPASSLQLEMQKPEAAAFGRRYRGGSELCFRIIRSLPGCTSW